MKNLILIKNNQISAPECGSGVSNSVIGTLLANLAYFGYAPNVQLLKAIKESSDKNLSEWWSQIDPVLKEVTGASRKMDKFVVYKNFPRECLEKTQAEYWISQILMYIGFPNEFFTEEESDRPLMLENLKLKVLSPATNESYLGIYNALLNSPVRWTYDQTRFVHYLIFDEQFKFSVESCPFKENLIEVIKEFINRGINIKISSPIDVLRLAVGLSEGDVTLKTDSKFITFKRSVRRYFLGLLEEGNYDNLLETIARKKELWKRFFVALRPSDYPRFTNCNRALNNSYNDTVYSFASITDSLIKANDKSVLALYEKRPGEFVRAFYRLYTVFGAVAVKSFNKILPQLTVSQLVKFKKYLSTINIRKFSVYAPKGNWSKMQYQPNKRQIKEKDINLLVSSIDLLLKKRVKKFHKSVSVANKTSEIVLQGNDATLTPYGRGTSFDIPENIKFIRVASYWQAKGGANSWFDCGINLFDSNWSSRGTVCWNSNRFGDACIFSGDPTNSKEMEGRACQMIDLYIDKAINHGIRYGVWNILCFSGIPFSKAEDVFAAIQMGENAESGKLFEPSRCQLSFPIKDDSKAKYLLVLDLEKRKIIYIDANLKASVHSAVSNADNLSKVMPAFMEYVETLPTIKDLFESSHRKNGSTKILYSDAKDSIKNGSKAYVFKPENKNNDFEQINVQEILKS